MIGLPFANSETSGFRRDYEGFRVTSRSVYPVKIWVSLSTRSILGQVLSLFALLSKLVGSACSQAKRRKKLPLVKVGS